MDRLALLWPLPPRGALRNAREAMASLADAVSDRLTLTAALDSTDRPSPSKSTPWTRTHGPAARSS